MIQASPGTAWSSAGTDNQWVAPDHHIVYDARPTLSLSEREEAEMRGHVLSLNLLLLSGCTAPLFYAHDRALEIG